MGFFDKWKATQNPDEEGYTSPDDNYYGDNDQDFTEDTGAEEQTEQPAADYGTQSLGGINLSGSSIELKVVKPDSYKNTNQIADHLLYGRTVVLNLESTNKETARRLIDFLTGVAYSIGGDIKKVSNNTYVITPKNVAVSNDQMRGKDVGAEGESVPAGDFSDLA